MVLFQWYWSYTAMFITPLSVTTVVHVVLNLGLEKGMVIFFPKGTFCHDV